MVPAIGSFSGRKRKKGVGGGGEGEDKTKELKQFPPKELGSGTRKFHLQAFPRRVGQGPCVI